MVKLKARYAVDIQCLVCNDKTYTRITCTDSNGIESPDEVEVVSGMLVAFDVAEVLEDVDLADGNKDMVVVVIVDGVVVVADEPVVVAEVVDVVVVRSDDATNRQT